MTDESRSPMTPRMNNFHLDFDYCDLDFNDEESVTSKEPIDEQIISLPTVTSEKALSAPVSFLCSFEHIFIQFQIVVYHFFNVDSASLRSV